MQKNKDAAAFCLVTELVHTLGPEFIRPFHILLGDVTSSLQTHHTIRWAAGLNPKPPVTFLGPPGFVGGGGGSALVPAAHSCISSRTEAQQLHV